MKFSELKIHPEIKSALTEMGLVDMTPIQDQAIPLLLEGKDVIGVSKTGTGKTAAFLIPLLERLLHSERQGSRALVLAPTRELAIQSGKYASKLLNQLDLKVATIYGGEDMDKQRALLQENPDILVGTPGRLIDFYKRGDLKLDQVEYLVLDEADRLLDLGFKDDIHFIVKSSAPNRQTALFTATLDLRVKMMAYPYMKNPTELSTVSSDSFMVDKIEQMVMHVSSQEKFLHLIHILTTEKWERVMIFSNTKALTQELSRGLRGVGYHASGISSLLSQDARQKLLESFRRGDTSILVATDVASRGLDIDDVHIVVNYDVPEEAESFIHRVGRTARAGAAGKAFTLVSPEDGERFLSIEERYLKTKLPILWLDEKEIMSARDWIREKKKQMDGGRPEQPRKPHHTSPQRALNSRGAFAASKKVVKKPPTWIDHLLKPFHFLASFFKEKPEPKLASKPLKPGAHPRSSGPRSGGPSRPRNRSGAPHGRRNSQSSPYRGKPRTKDRQSSSNKGKN